MELNFTPVFESWRFLLSGLGTTVSLAILVSLCSFLLGGLLAILRLYGPKWLSHVIVFYIDTMRAIPVLVILVWVYFAMPILTGINLPPFLSAFFALSFHLAAYVAEVFRAGITSIRPGQVRAGMALGMSQWQLLRHILLPQAVVRMLPAFGSLLSLAVKDTAIATVIAVPELMRRAEAVAGQHYVPVEVFTTVMVLFFIIIFPLTRGTDWLYRRISFLGRS